MNHNPTTDPQWFGVPSDGRITLQELEAYGHLAAEYQFYANWNIGDVARIAARRFPDTWQQVFPEWISPDHIARCKAVAEAYPYEDRNPQATWSVHMQNAKRPDRVAVIRAHVEAGHTSDEARRLPAPSTASANDWLLAIDVNYFIHRYFHSGAGVEAASTFDGWLTRMIDRMRVKPDNRQKGLTDVVCCFDAPTNHRRKLTEGWEAGYKPRADKDAELANQLNLAPQLLRARNIPCVTIPDMEADDVMASYAKQFPGRVTLLTQDKDMRQCLSATCNILLDVAWEENTETGDHVPVYKWVTAKSHTEEGMTYSGAKVVGITPEQWPHFQAIAGDSTDGIKGVEGIGSKGAMELILAHGTLQGVIDACKDVTTNLSKTKRLAVLEFEQFAETTLKLVTLRTDLPVPMVTKLI